MRYHNIGGGRTVRLDYFHVIVGLSSEVAQRHGAVLPPYHIALVRSYIVYKHLHRALCRDTPSSVRGRAGVGQRQRREALGVRVGRLGDEQQQRLHTTLLDHALQQLG